MNLGGRFCSLILIYITLINENNSCLECKFRRIKNELKLLLQVTAKTEEKPRLIKKNLI